MNRSLAIVVLVACGTPTKLAPPIPKPPPADAGPVEHDAPAIAPPVVHTSPGRPLIEAPHGGAITTVAVTADGKAAISCDDLGGMRLWPALDGSREPRVVDLQAPRALAIGRHGDGFGVVLLDDVGGLVIAELDADGRTLRHVSVAGDPSYLGVAMTEHGVLAWRSDQTIVLLSLEGVVTTTLPPEPSQRIASVAVTGEHAVALIDAVDADGKPLKTRARQLQLGRTVSWGAWIEADGLGPAVALSASGKRLAVMMHPTNSPSVLQVLVVDTVTGKPIANIGKHPAIAIGFFDDDHLALALPAGVTAVEITPAEVTPEVLKTLEPAALQAQPTIVVAAGKVVLAHDGDLQISTATDNHWLGYDLESPAVAASAPNGGLVIGLNETFVQLDNTLHAIGSPDVLVAKDSRVAELHWLGGDDWLVESSAQSDGATALSLIDIAAHKVSVLRSGVPVVQLMLYEPSTHLLALSLGEAPTIDRYDPARHKLDHLATLAKPNGFEQRELAPVAPALAGGVQLVSVQMRDRMTLRWVSDLAALDTGPSVVVDGSLAGVDPAGHVFVWQTTGNTLELVVYAAGKRIGTLPADGMVALWPDPGGTQVIETSQSQVSLIAVDGTKRWTIPVQSATEALWLDDGGLALISAGGLARLDPATGAITSSRCGWRFGLATKPHPPAPRVDPVCVQQLGR